MTLQLLHSEFPHIWGKFYFIFYQCMTWPRIFSGMAASRRSNRRSAEKPPPRQKRTRPPVYILQPGMAAESQTSPSVAGRRPCPDWNRRSCRKMKTTAKTATKMARNVIGHHCLREQEVDVRGILSIFDPHTSKTSRYEPKVALLHLWRVNVKTTPGFIHIPLADFLTDKTAP